MKRAGNSSFQGFTQGLSSAGGGLPLRKSDASVPWYVPLEDVSRKESPLKVEPTGLGDLLDESVRDGEAQAAPSVLAWHLGGQ